MARCASCGSELKEGSRFCSECGAPVPLKRTCPSCGMEVPDGSRFCMYCGSRLEAAEVPPAAGGFSVGSRNVIAGDIIGRKDDIHISGNATILRNEDDTRKISPCSICGRHTPITEGYTCPRCGRFVCSSCYDDEHGICLDCRRKDVQEAESDYLAYLRAAISGPIGKIQKEVLIKEAQKRDIDAGKASLMISSTLKEIGAEELSEVLSRVDRDILEKAAEIYFSGRNGSAEDAYALLRPLYERRSSNAEVLDTYLQVLRDADRNAYSDLIVRIAAASPLILLLRIEDAAEAGQLLEAEDMLREAKLLYPENTMIKAEEVMLLLRLAHSLGLSSYSEEARELAAGLEDEGSILERSYAMKARISSGVAVDFTEVKSEIRSHKLYGRLCNVSSEVYVGTEIYDRASISDAIAFASSGMKIIVRPGIYKETLSFDKDIEIISLAAYEGRPIKLEEMPVIVSEVPCEVSSKLAMKGIIITSDASLKPVDISDLLKEKAAGKLNAKAPALQAGIPFLNITGTAELRDCIIARVTGTAIGLRSGASLSFIDSSIAGAHSCGIYAENESKLRISGGRIAGCGIAGLYSNAAAEVKDLAVSACMRGFFLDGDNGAYAGCRAFGNTLDGICISNGNPGLYGCISLKNAKNGYQIEQESHPVLSDCRAESNTCNGFFFAGKSEAELRNCISESNEEDGYRIDNGSKPVISNCTASGNAINGFRSFFRSKPSFVKCSALKNMQSGFMCCGATAAKLSDCVASENGYSGFALTGTSESGFSLCRAEKNVGDGFRTEAQAYASFVECIASRNGSSGFSSNDESCSSCVACVSDKNEQFGFDSLNISNPMFDGCTASRNKKSGFLFHDESTAEVKNCVSSENVSNGYSISKSAAPKIIGSKATGNCFAGFGVSSKSSPSICDCSAVKNKKSGFTFNSVSSAIIENCISSENEQSGFSLSEMAATVLKGCRASGNLSDGYSVTDKATGRLEGCISESNAQFGYSVNKNSAPSLSKCNASKNKYSGFIFGDASVGDASQCSSSENGESGFFFCGSSSAAVRFSKARQNRYRGFCFTESSVSVCESCISEANELSGFEVRNASKPAIKQCSAMRNKKNGFLYTGDAGGTLENCTSADNEGSGYNIAASADPSLADNEAHGNKSQDFCRS